MVSRFVGNRYLSPVSAAARTPDATVGEVGRGVGRERANGQPFAPLPSAAGDVTLLTGRFVSRERVLMLMRPAARGGPEAVLWDWKAQKVRRWDLEGVGDDAVLSLDGRRVAWTVGGSGLSGTLAMRRLEW